TLVFSERVMPGPAVNIANYTFNHGLSAADAQQISPDSVQLHLDKPLSNGFTYQLAIKNQEDIFGNTAVSIDTSFTFYKISRPDSGDVFINEFMYDPPTGSTEYVELYNPTNKSFNLQGWTISDNTGAPQPITNQKMVLPP